MVKKVSGKEPTLELPARSEVIYLCDFCGPHRGNPAEIVHEDGEYLCRQCFDDCHCVHCGAPAVEFHPVDESGVCSACYRAALAEAEETKDVFENLSRRDVLAMLMLVFVFVILVVLPVWSAVQILSGK